MQAKPSLFKFYSLFLCRGEGCNCVKKSIFRLIKLVQSISCDFVTRLRKTEDLIEIILKNIDFVVSSSRVYDTCFIDRENIFSLVVQLSHSASQNT